MRVFKHGDALAIVIPPQVKASSQVSENDEYEFFELEPGVLVLVGKAKLSATVNEKVTSLLLRKAMESSSSPATKAAPKREPENFTAAPQFIRAAELAKKPPVPPIPPIESTLGAKGFAVMDEPEARTASKALEAYLQTGDVLGAKGFDSKFYAISREQFEPLAEKIMARIQRGTEIVPSKAAEALKEDPQKVACAFQVLRERGDALEKKRGVFVLLD